MRLELLLGAGAWLRDLATRSSRAGETIVYACTTPGRGIRSCPKDNKPSVFLSESEKFM